MRECTANRLRTTASATLDADRTGNGVDYQKSVNRRPLRAGLFGLVLVAHAAFLSGCNTDPATHEPQAQIPEQNQAITADDAAQFSLGVEAAIKDRDLTRMNQLFSRPEMFERVFEDLELTRKERRSLESRINRGNNVSRLIRRIFSVLDRGGRFDRLRIETDNSPTRVIYRLYCPANDDLDYIAFFLKRGFRNRIRIVDVDSRWQDRTLANSIREQMFRELDAGGNTTLRTRSGADWRQEIRQPLESFDQYRQVQENVIDGEWERAWELTGELPDRLLNRQEIQGQRILIAGHLDGGQLEQAVEDARKRCPASLQVEWNILKVFRRNRNAAGQLEAVDRMVKLTGDRFLELFKLPALLDEKRTGELRQVLQAVESTGNVDPVWLYRGRFEYAVLSGDFAEAVNWLEKLVDQDLIAKNIIEEHPRYTGLRKSREYKDWLHK